MNLIIGKSFRKFFKLRNKRLIQVFEKKIITDHNCNHILIWNSLIAGCFDLNAIGITMLHSIPFYVQCDSLLFDYRIETVFVQQHSLQYMRKTSRFQTNAHSTLFVDRRVCHFIWAMFIEFETLTWMLWFLNSLSSHSNYANCIPKQTDQISWQFKTIINYLCDIPNAFQLI